MNQLGRLFICGVSGLTLTEEERSFIAENEVTGVLLFAKNYQNKNQLIQLTNELRAVRSDILIAVDHEGGRVQRFREGFTHFPPMMSVAKTNLVYEAHRQMARELRSCGVNTDFTPCVDLLTNKDCEVIGDRAFGDTPEFVSECGAQAIKGLTDGGVFSCAKHFPGHGDTEVDSHDDLPVINTSLELLRERELVSFKASVDAGVPIMMLAHAMMPALDPHEMTTTSPATYDLLRNEMGFNGLALTDDMEMGAIIKDRTYTDAAKASIMAGADLIEYRSFEQARDVINDLNKIYQENQDFQNIVDQRVDRVKSFIKENLPIEPIEYSEKIFEEGNQLLNKINEALIL